jgi:hypothetical protein
MIGFLYVLWQLLCMYFSSLPYCYIPCCCVPGFAHRQRFNNSIKITFRKMDVECDIAEMPSFIMCISLRGCLGGI